MAPAIRNPELAKKIEQMKLTIAPIVHVMSGHPPPEFPGTILQLFLLTEDQLDTMAHFYSQSTRGPLTYTYPQTMEWNRPFLRKPNPGEMVPEGCWLNDVERLRIKMRMFAKFIGMRGAETPSWEYERHVEVLRNRIAKSIEEEERAMMGPRKFYRGPPALP
ncbi:hypothetical protein BDV96DRAFT_597292 [Lophiotrema nucula]|uniref:Uncharacterized protein n=1 Tax=Lophiotrema nucula TaxID=690887 RepID=A0A6A5ZJP8_9PLEO|nr:hypothetical protein BDV96DRAFT_597292 [Lophiotrema nucula]